MVYNKVNFDPDCIFEKIQNMLFSRQRMENYRLKRHNQTFKVSV